MRFRVQKTGQRIARIIDCRSRLASGSVHAGGITEVPLQVWQHRFARFIAQRSSGVVVEINHPAKISRGDSGGRECFGTIRNCFSS